MSVSSAISEYRARIGRQFGSAQGLIVLVESGGLVVRGAHGPASVGPMTRALIAHVEREGKPHLVLDASQSFLPGCRATPPLEFRSAACAPVLVEGRAQGYLVLRQPGAGAFSYANLQCINDWARELGPRLQSGPTLVSESTAPGLLYPALALMLLALAWAAVGFLWPGRPVVRATPTLAPRLAEASPRQVAGSFLGAVRQRQWTSAYHLLAAELQGQLSLADFQAVGEKYLSDQEHRWDLTYRRPLEGEPDGLLLVEPARGARKPWRWRFVQTSQGWRIGGFESGPWS
ncbi:MAG: GAF domain-containing protein [Vulcanimicrobiota bacterium]